MRIYFYQIVVFFYHKSAFLREFLQILHSFDSLWPKRAAFFVDCTSMSKTE